MHQSNSSASGGRLPPPSATNPHRKFTVPHHHNYHGPPFRRPPNQQNRFRPPFSPNYRDRPQARPNFIVQVYSDAPSAVKEAEVEAVIQKLKFQPQKSDVVASNYISGKLYYEQWNEALETVVQLWELKLNESRHSFWPRVVCNVEVPSDKSELNDRLKELFMEKLKGLKEGDLVEKWMKKLGIVLIEINKVLGMLKKPQRLGLVDELLGKRKGLEAERDLILNRVQEFKNAVRCIENYLENEETDEEGSVPIFRFLNGEIDWRRIHRLIMRECRRLDDGLPIYAHRRDILKQVHCQQVTVLIGETGSGKSTQLVQFLADSGISGHESIICTQPRKISAISLAQRVKEESCGCYMDTSVTCYPSYSSVQEFESKVIFMTDNCLLQHYMSDKQLSKISCIIIDEAHERSLNSDLLLGLIKNLLCQRPFLRLIIMSATVNADQFARYFFGCMTLHVSGRNFPVDIKYVPCEFEALPTSKLIPSYAVHVLRMVSEIHKNEKEGTILSFLTSQMEVEWACEKFQSSSAIALPLHGKLSYEDQSRVFLSYPGKRKVIFATNVAETSLTIPGVKYVVDSGMAKESRFDPATGMNVLRVCKISQSAANQRAGRAGRTEPGTCYRLYMESDFESMLPHQEPDIRKVHLGVAVLKILALEIKDVQNFDFVDAPSDKAIDMAIRSLIQLGAVVMKNDVYELTAEGRDMVKLGMEPRLGKIILECFRQRMGKEGLVLAAVMANSSNIFCRVGTEDDKLKSDCLKVQFCHPDGDLFTLLAVYRAWEAVPNEKKNVWCWENSINAKSLRRCQNTVLEMETCLQNELNIIVPNYWYWNPQTCSEHDKRLKYIILSSLAENVAMYAGYDQLGYQVALTRKHVQLHPSCSLLNFGRRPAWVVFSEILSVSNEYLVCVTACDFDHLSTLSPPPVFDFLNMDTQQLQKRVLSGLGSVSLKRFCGKFSSNVRHVVSTLRASCGDERIGVEVNVDQNEVLLYASSRDMEKVLASVTEELDYEKKMLENECLEKCLYNGGAKVLPSIALVGGGAEIKHLELEKRYLTVDIFHSDKSAIDDKELMVFLEKFTSSRICSITKFSGSGPDNEKEKWGRVTFLTPDAAKKAVDSSPFEFCGGLLKVAPSRIIFGGDSFPSLTANISWPRKPSKGVGFVKCHPDDVASIVNDFSNLVIQGKLVWCQASLKFRDSVILSGLDRDLSEDDIRQVLYTATNRRFEFFLNRGNAVDNPPPVSCEEAILRELSPFIPKRSPHGNCVSVRVYPIYPKDHFIRANITFDGSLHLEAAKALEHIDKKVLPGFLSWQRIRCQQLFHSSVYCTAPVYLVIRDQLDSLIRRLQQQKGCVECYLDRNLNGSCRVKISATATKIVAELRRPLEQLTKGKIIQHPDITPSVLQTLFSRDGILLMKSIQRDTHTYIGFNKQTTILRVFGSPEKIDQAQQFLVKSLLSLHDSKHLEVHLRDGVYPPDMMKRLIQRFGPDLRSLKELVPEAELSLNTRRHCIYIVGTKESKQKVEAIIHELAQTSGSPSLRNENDVACPICLCELEDKYTLEGCCHKFCRLCLIEQCEAAIRSRDSFPLCCTREDCGARILIADLRYLLSSEKLDELFRASLDAYVAASGGAYRFCPSPDCPSVYRMGGPDEVFVCGACFVETCTRCHVEYHPYLSCEKYREFKSDPDLSLKEWCMGKEHVKKCPFCEFTIEKIDGCNHIECRCGRHVCWVCLEVFASSDDCYTHLRAVHGAIN